MMQQQGQPFSTARRSRSLVTMLSAAAGCALVVLLFASGGGRGTRGGAGNGGGSDNLLPGASGQADAGRVPVIIYVMSRCPDAQFCEGFLAPILAPLKGVVRLRAEYIVREAEDEAADDDAAAAAAGDKQGAGTKNATAPAFACMHGPQECAGNMAQLCLQKRMDEQIATGSLSADATVTSFLAFLNCGWKSPAAIGTAAGTRACLAAVGMTKGAEQDAVVACASGAEGAALLAASHAATSAAGATNSCTIDVAGRRRCVRDGGRFRDCAGGSEPADFARTICAALGDQERAAAAAAGVCK